MNRRLPRIRRIVDLRERAVKHEVASLSFAWMSEEAARDEEQTCRENLLAAEAQRRDLSSEPGPALRYLEFEDWLETLGIKHSVAQQALRVARSETERAIARVRQAQVSLKQVEQLVTRLVAQEGEQQRRRERRQEDEVSQQLSSVRKGR